MARSSTTFELGNRSGFQPGNRLALKHGAYSEEEIQARMPAIRERVEAELAEHPFRTPPDESLIRSYCWVTSQVELQRERFESLGGMYYPSGKQREGADFHLRNLKAQLDLAKVLGLGAVPRAQVAVAMAGVGRDVALMKAAQERARQRLAELAD